MSAVRYPRSQNPRHPQQAHHSNHIQPNSRFEHRYRVHYARQARALKAAGYAAGVAGGSLVPHIFRRAAQIMRFISWLFVLLISVNALLAGFISNRTLLITVNQLLGAFVPAPIAGLYVYQTIFGGVLRGDFCILAMICLFIDWFLCTVSQKLDTLLR